jgi:hypothetical protein
MRFYTHHLKHKNFPGLVYSMLPAIAEFFELDNDGKAWLAWLNGNTQNAVTSYLLLEQAQHPKDWKKALDFYNDNFKALEWDTDRRHQKSVFGKATEQWIEGWGRMAYQNWVNAAEAGWKHAWKHSLDQPYMGRISAWSMLEFAKILIPEIPDVEDWFLKASSSRSHRNSLCLLAGHEGAYAWDGDDADIPAMLDLFPEIEALAEALLAEAKLRNPDDPNVTRLTMESALCTFKSCHKPDRRYPGVYADMFYERIRKAEFRLTRELSFFWDLRQEVLPQHLRLEDNPTDPGLVPLKQNWFRETGEMPMMSYDFPDMQNSFDEKVKDGSFGIRKDKKW